MKRKRYLIAVSCWIMVLFFFPFTSLGEEKKDLPSIEIKYPAVTPKNNPWAQLAVMQHKKWIEEITGGRAKVTVYWANSLVPARDTYRALQVGIADFGYVSAAVNPGIFPLTEIFHLPGLAPRLPAGNLVLMELFRLYPEFEKQFNPKVKHMAAVEFMLSDLHSRKPVRSINDLKGMKLACQTDDASTAMGKLGAAASTVAWTDLYQILERGVADGVVCAWGTVRVTRIHEVAKYHTVLRLFPSVGHYMFNRATWNKFTPDEQEKLKLLEPWIAYSNTAGLTRLSYNLRSAEIKPEKGHEMIYWSEKDMGHIRSALKPIWDAWADKMEAKGYPAKAILKDALRLIDTYTYE